MKVLAFGEVLWDVYSDKKYLGGAPLNFAAHLAKHGEDAYVLSALGDDDLGDEALTVLKGFGIKPDYVFINQEKQTGKCLVTLDENQIPSYNLLNDVAYDYIPCNIVNDSFDVVYFGTLALRNEYNHSSLKSFLKCGKYNDVFVDVNIRPPFYSRKTVTFAAENATIIKISQEEMDVTADLLCIKGSVDYTSFAEALKDAYKNLKCIIITLGENGSYVLDAIKNKGYYCKGASVEVKSTVGAGDSFSAAFLSKYYSGHEIQSCLDHASRIAGYVVSQYDAVPDYNIADFT